jgi:hypothetical protein
MVDIWDSLDDVDLRSISGSHGGAREGGLA